MARDTGRQGKAVLYRRLGVLAEVGGPRVKRRRELAGYDVSNDENLRCIGSELKGATHIDLFVEFGKSRVFPRTIFKSK